MTACVLGVECAAGSRWAGGVFRRGGVAGRVCFVSARCNFFVPGSCVMCLPWCALHVGNHLHAQQGAGILAHVSFALLQAH
jgi:hypothetical protein